MYGPLSTQCTLSVALTTVLRAIHGRFGDQPQIGKLFQAKNSDSVATFFKLTPKLASSKPIMGLVIVSRPAGALPAAAMIYDDADHFGKTVKDMMKTLNEAWHPASGRTQSTNSGSVERSAREATASVKAAKVQPLNNTPFPDGTGSVGLPDGWHVSFAGRGGIHANGPNGEAIHLGVINSGIYDTLNAQAQRQMAYANRVGRPYLACPLTNDLVSAFRTVSQQISRQNHVPDPTLTVTSNTSLPPGPNGLSDSLVVGEMDLHDGKGPMTVSMRIGIIRPGALGMWSLCVNSVLVPTDLADEEWPTMTAIVGSWRQNGAQIQKNTDIEIGKIHQIGEIVDKRIAASHAANDAHNAAVYKQWDNQDKYSKSFQNYQFDRTEVLDKATDERGALDYNSAALLVEGDPNRYQYINPPDFVKGKDY